MSDFAEYNRLLEQAKIKALQVLQRLLETSSDPVEKRRLADAILKATGRLGRNATPPPPTSPQPPAAATPPSQPREPAIPSAVIDALYLDTRSLNVEPAPRVTFDPHDPSPVALAAQDARDPLTGGGSFPPPFGPIRA